MTDKRLAGKKIAVVVDSQYIPGEIKIYQERFAQYGAGVDLVSRLWGKSSDRFYSTVEPGVIDELEWLEVSKDFDSVDLDDYAAVVVAANYISVRLRWIERDDLDAVNAAESARDVPAARFFRRAMENPRIIKGAACHALWLLTPSPNILAGRKVICNKVVLADVINAGGVYTPCPPGTPESKQVVVDRDLVTNNSWHASAELVDRITDLILTVPADSRYSPPGARPVDNDATRLIARQTAAKMSRMTFVPETLPKVTIPTAEVSLVMAAGKYDFARLNADVQTKMGISGISKPASGSEILFVAADHGVWGSELTLAMKVFEAAGYEVRVATLTGRAPMFLPVSLNEKFEDPTWGAGWVAPGEAELAWRVQKLLFDDESKGRIVKLDGLIPHRPQAKDGITAKQKYEKDLGAGLQTLANVRGVVVPGGTGAIIDLADNSQLEAILEMTHDAGNPIIGICYGVLALLYAQDGAMMKGASLTIHNRADDFVTGTGALTDVGISKLRGYLEKGDRDGFIGDASVWTSEWRSPTRKAEVEAEAICGPGVHVISPYTPDSCAVIDSSKLAAKKGALITGRSIHCGYDAGLAMVAQQLGNEPLASPVMMMTGGVKAHAPKPEDYNANIYKWL
jgi:putative intracellular protease/amidase